MTTTSRGSVIEVKYSLLPSLLPYTYKYKRSRLISRLLFAIVTIGSVMSWIIKKIIIFAKDKVNTCHTYHSMLSESPPRNVRVNYNPIENALLGAEFSI